MGYSIVTNMNRVVEEKDVIMIVESWMGTYMAYLTNKKCPEAWGLQTCHRFVM